MLLVLEDVFYDETIKEAVRAFQADYDLQVDGIAGPITLGVITVELADPEASE